MPQSWFTHHSIVGKIIEWYKLFFWFFPISAYANAFKIFGYFSLQARPFLFTVFMPFFQ